MCLRSEKAVRLNENGAALLDLIRQSALKTPKRINLHSVAIVLCLTTSISTGSAGEIENRRNEKSAVAVLIHGFGDTATSMKPLGEYLVSLGIAVEYVLLPGHGSTVQEFGRTTWRDWFQGGLDKVKEVKAASGQVYLVGFSIGANIAALISIETEIGKLVLVSPAIDFRERSYLPFKTKAIIGGLHGVVPYLPKLSRGDVVNRSRIHQRGPHYRWHPVEALHQLTLLMDETASKAPSIDAPCLVIHGKADKTVDFRATERFFAAISSREKELFLLESSGHFVLLDQESDVLLAKISSFLIETQ